MRATPPRHRATEAGSRYRTRRHWPGQVNWTRRTGVPAWADCCDKSNSPAALRCSRSQAGGLGERALRGSLMSARRGTQVSAGSLWGLARALACRGCGERVGGLAAPVSRNSRRSQPRPPGELARAGFDGPGGRALGGGGLLAVVRAAHAAHHFQLVGAVYSSSTVSWSTAAAPRRRTPTPKDWA